MSTAAFVKLSYQQIVDWLSSRRRHLAAARAKWGRIAPKEAYRQNRYFDLRRATTEGLCVDDKTWVDLEFPKIFSEIDSTETPIGSQALYRRMRYYRDPRQLAEELAEYRKLAGNAALRERLQLALGPLRSDIHSDVADWVFGSAPIGDKRFRWLPWWSVLCALSLAAVVALSLPLGLWLVFPAINVALIYLLSFRAGSDIDAIRACVHLLDVGDGLAAMSRTDGPPQLARLADEKAERARARRALGWVTTLQGPLISSVTVWLNLLFLGELAALARALQRFPQARHALASTFESVGSLDSSIAIASYLVARPNHCVPSVSDDGSLELERASHPLVENPVPNSIRLGRRSALITGSNMAGKTTFVKMVGINIIFGRTLGFCFAAAATIPPARVMAAIRGDHSVESGKSRYFAEIETIHSFVEMSSREGSDVFLIDEPFSGTNTVERLAACRSVLEEIAKNARALVTTHDVELESDLSAAYDLYYFQEDPDVDGYFDYTLRQGSTRRRNAIRLLARKGYAPEIVERALAYTAEYAQRLGAAVGAEKP